jgi:hypothetical protein
MKTAFLISFLGAAVAASATSSFAQQAKIYRCGNTYTNSVAEAQSRGCKPLEGGNITVVEGTRVSLGAPKSSDAGGSSSVNSGIKFASVSPQAPRAQSVESSEQKARDSDARVILEAELAKAETRHVELLKEYNNGEPEKMGPEHKNHQKYIDRVAELKASISRNENDIAGLKRELSRVPAK